MEQRTPNLVRRAFTLVELLVVIGIIALLIGILLPALNAARQHATEVACESNLHQMGIALIMYNNETGYYPGARDLGTEAGNPAGQSYAVWPTRLRHYMGSHGNYSQGVFRCPTQDYSVFEWKVNDNSLGGPYATDSDTGYGYNKGERLLVESTLAAQATHFSYGYNDWGAYDQGDSGAPALIPPQTQRGLGGDLNMAHSTATPELKASLVKHAADVIAIADCTPDGKYDFNLDPRDFTQAPGTVHYGGANILYCDGHVVWHALKDVALFNLKTHVNFPLSGSQFQALSPQWNYDFKP